MTLLFIKNKYIECYFGQKCSNNFLKYVSFDPILPLTNKWEDKLTFCSPLTYLAASLTLNKISLNTVGTYRGELQAGGLD